MVKTPLYPCYSLTVLLLHILDGTSAESFRSMWNTIWELRGTPQNSVDWTNPDAWIDNRLFGSDKEIALKLWIDSKKKINPRWTRGDQFLINGYKLLEDIKGFYRLTEKGKIFVSDKDNAVAREIDKEEGLLQLLLQASAIGRGKRADFIPEWRKYLDTNSNVRQDSVVKDYLRLRLVNLWDRGYLDREGNTYAITQEGQQYLNINGNATRDTSLGKLALLSREVEGFNQEQRSKLRIYLAQSTPIQFEQLVRDLLTAMGYEDIVVTSPTNDKGVDVTAISQQGITTVKEVIQVKRFTKTNVQRTVLDGLRGSLHRFDAFQGTIITLSDFAKGAKDSAFEKGAAPITLINGEKLIDLLIASNLVIKKNTFEYYSIDYNYFSKAIEEELE